MKIYISEQHSHNYSIAILTHETRLGITYKQDVWINFMRFIEEISATRKSKHLHYSGANFTSIWSLRDHCYELSQHCLLFVEVITIRMRVRSLTVLVASGRIRDFIFNWVSRSYRVKDCHRESVVNFTRLQYWTELILIRWLYH